MIMEKQTTLIEIKKELNKVDGYKFGAMYGQSISLLLHSGEITMEQIMSNKKEDKIKIAEKSLKFIKNLNKIYELEKKYIQAKPEKMGFKLV